MHTRLSHYLKRILLVGLLLDWTQAWGAEHPTSAELMEKYGLSPGMNITQENAHLIKDLVPEAFYRRVMAGEYGPITIGKLDPPDIFSSKLFPPEYYQKTERHAEQYDVDEEGGIIDKANGKRPWPMPYGLPFPKLDLTEDPRKVGTKIQWNMFSLPGTFNEAEWMAPTYSSSSRGAPERMLFSRAFRQYIDFRQDPLTINRPVSWQDIAYIMGPAELFGSAILTWRWTDPKKWDSVWSYSPSVRRIRRLTSANRSDAFFGTEYVQDDVNTYGGKVEMFDWKYVGKGAMLMAFWRIRSQAPEDYVARVVLRGKPSSRYPGVPTAFESAELVKTDYGFNKSPQQHVGWWLYDRLWVVVPAYIVEGFTKDPYYNYGRQIFWIEANSFTPVWKQTYNRSGEYWRTMMLMPTFLRYTDPQGKERGGFLGTPWVDDARLNRGFATCVSSRTAECLGDAFHFHNGADPDILSLSKFLQFGK